MHLRPRPRNRALLLIALAIALALGAAPWRPAPARATETPVLSAPSAGVPPLALDPYLALLEARASWQRGDEDAARAALERARALDPGLLEPDLAAAAFDMPWATNAAGERLLAAFTTLESRFALQSQTLAGLAWGGLAILAAAITLLAVAYASIAARPLHHLLAERFTPALTPRLAAVAAGLLLVLPLVWGAGPLVTALALLVLAAPPRARRQLVLAGAGALLILGLGLAPRLAPRVLHPADFEDMAQVLDAADHAPLTPALAARLEQAAAGGIDEALLVHATALSRAGRCREAEPLLVRYTHRRPADSRGPLAIGNCLLAAGDPRSAVGYYRRAAILDSTAAAPLVNLALAYSQVMQFEMANEALSGANRIDPEAVAAVSGARTPGAAAPIPARLHAGELWALFRTERPGLGAEPPLCVRMWLPWGGGPQWPLGLLLIGVAWWARRTLGKKPLPGPCAGCGHMVCPRCMARRPGLSLCRSCQARIGDLPAEDALKRLLAAERARRRGRERFSRIAWNLLLPGHGLVAAGRPFAASMVLTLVAVAGVAFMTGGHPVVPLPAAPASGGGIVGPQSFGLFLLAALALAATLGITSRPSLGRATRGRLVPLDQERLRRQAAAAAASRPIEAAPERIEWRTGTDG